MCHNEIHFFPKKMRYLLRPTIPRFQRIHSLCERGIHADALLVLSTLLRAPSHLQSDQEVQVKLDAQRVELQPTPQLLDRRFPHFGMAGRTPGAAKSLDESGRSLESQVCIRRVKLYRVVKKAEGVSVLPPLARLLRQLCEAPSGDHASFA